MDKVDLILRRPTATGRPTYREVQVKFGKLYPVDSGWEREHFDFSSWRFFKEDELRGWSSERTFSSHTFLSRDPTPVKPAYQGDIFIFPVRDFDRLIRCAIPSKVRKVYLSRLQRESKKGGFFVGSLGPFRTSTMRLALKSRSIAGISIF